MIKYSFKSLNNSFIRKKLPKKLGVYIYFKRINEIFKKHENHNHITEIYLEILFLFYNIFPIILKKFNYLQKQNMANTPPLSDLKNYHLNDRKFFSLIN